MLGALEAMEANASKNFQVVHLAKEARHWIQKEKPNEVLQEIKQFIVSGCKDEKIPRIIGARIILAGLYEGYFAHSV